MSSVKAIEMSIQEIVDASEKSKSSENKRTFEYNLDDKTAKAKLVKGGKRIPFEVVHNSTSSNLNFSTGAWNHVVLPTAQYWKSIQGDKVCKVGPITVKVASVSFGLEASNKHIDTLVVFYADRDKVVLQMYNTTQRILVNGHGYRKLIDYFLKPYFESKAALHNGEIVAFNNAVLETMGPKRVKRSSVRYKSGSTFSCKSCEFASSTSVTLKKHMRTDHAISFNSTKSSSSSLREPLKHSTRNNSIHEQEALLQDNMTITNISDHTQDIALEENVLKYTCLDGHSCANPS